MKKTTLLILFTGLFLCHCSGELIAPEEFYSRGALDANLAADNADSNDVPEDEGTVLASLGSGTVTYKILNVAGDSQSGYRLFTASIGPANYRVVDSQGNDLDKNNLDLEPGSVIEFEFLIQEVWDLQCVRDFEIEAYNLSGLSFEGLYGDVYLGNPHDVVPWSTSVTKTGATTLFYEDLRCGS
jgi:hypothetical protein